MLFSLPTHKLYLINNNGTKESVICSDFSSKKEVRDNVKYLFTKLSVPYDINKYCAFIYCDKNDVVLYNGSIKECFEEK